MASFVVIAPPAVIGGTVFLGVSTSAAPLLRVASLCIALSLGFFLGFFFNGCFSGSSGGKQTLP
jgi:hypothetical protein